MIRADDPSMLPRIAPSKLGDQSRYQPRRRPDTNGMPDPRNAFRTTIDGPLLNAIAQAAFKDHVASATPPDWHGRVRAMLIGDLERRFPAADMAIVARYELTKRTGRVIVLFMRHGLGEFFEIPTRDLPAVGSPQLFKTGDDVDSGPIALVPDIALPFFAARAAAQAESADFMDVRDWPRRFTHKHKRPPTWAEIEEAFPRIGAWMANKRSV